MKKLIPFYFVLIVFILGSCNSIQVTYDYDKTVDFTKFKTASFHGWEKDSDKVLNPFDKQRIEQSVKSEFENRGIQYVKEGGELVVGLYIVTQKKTEQVANTTSMGGYAGWGYGGYYGMGPGWGWGAPMASVTTVSNVDYTVGTLVIDVFSTADKKLIWEGRGTKTVGDSNPQSNEERVSKAVSAIMTDFPVKKLPTKK